MKESSCYHCQYFSRSPGIRNVYIFKCSYWGLNSKNILPEFVVIESIGHKCPFFKKRVIKKHEDKKKEEPDDNDDGLDIMI